MFNILNIAVDVGIYFIGVFCYNKWVRISVFKFLFLFTLLFALIPLKLGNPLSLSPLVKSNPVKSITFGR